MILHHLTCKHAHAKIQRHGVILPNPQPFLGDIELSWWTDDPGLPVGALGLTSDTLACDRTEYRYVADVPATPWIEYRKKLLPVFSEAVGKLELGRSPRHWFVCDVPVEAEQVDW